LSDCPQEKMGVLGKYCAECVYEREDQERLHFQGNINGRELLQANVTQVYAERDLALAVRVAGEVG